LIKASFEENIKNKKSDGSGPDFLVSLSGKDFFIECVCPNFSNKKILDEGDFDFEEKNVSETHVSRVSSGEDYFIAGRYSKAICDKDKYFGRQNTRGYNIIFVSSIKLDYFKQKKNNSKMRMSTRNEFNLSIHGKSFICFEPGKKGDFIEKVPIEILSRKIKEYKGIVLNNTDAVVLFTGFPFLDISTKPCEVYCSGTNFEVKNFIDKITSSIVE
jgi:hypothetical protein